MNYQEAITVVTTTCAIPSCPSTKLIDGAYQSLRKQLPLVKMLVLMDGYNSNYDPVRKIALDGAMYQPLNNYLNEHNYH